MFFVFGYSPAAERAKWIARNPKSRHETDEDYQKRANRSRPRARRLEEFAMPDTAKECSGKLSASGFKGIAVKFIKVVMGPKGRKRRTYMDISELPRGQSELDSSKS